MIRLKSNKCNIFWDYSENVALLKISEPCQVLIFGKPEPNLKPSLA